MVMGRRRTSGSEMIWQAPGFRQPIVKLRSAQQKGRSTIVYQSTLLRRAEVAGDTKAFHCERPPIVLMMTGGRERTKTGFSALLDGVG